MAPVKNDRILFNAIPEGYPEPGKHMVYDNTHTIDLEEVPLNGGFLIKTLDLSVEPYMRQRMRDANIPSYLPAFTLGEPFVGGGIGVVLRSEAPNIKPGDHIYELIPHQQYSVISDASTVHAIQNPYDLKWTDFLGVLGIPGHTAYMAWKEYSNAKMGQTVFISSGASAVGSFVIQLAKADGLKVIASAGSEEKVQYMKEIGADVAFNYKTTETREVLAKEGPIDTYWDNVGGPTFDAALEAASTGARFIACGTIAAYNDPRGVPIYNLHLVFAKSITIIGFHVVSLYPKWLDAFVGEIHPRVASGEIKHREQVFEGLESIGDAMVAVQKGMNKAKVVVHVADE